MDQELTELLAQSRRSWDLMTPQKRAEMLAAQRWSYVLGEAGMGSDADEAAYREAVNRCDKEMLRKLDAEAPERERLARAVLDQMGA
jgi:hypothetical protein